jgi:prophage regulatory protein
MPRRSNTSANTNYYSAKPRRILRIAQVVERVGLSRTALYQAIADRKFPEPIAILAGGRASGWLESAVEEFIDSRLADPTPRKLTNAAAAKLKADLPQSRRATRR